MSTEAQIACTTCGRATATKTTASGTLRLPRRWKRDATEQPHCPPCWANRYVLRAVTVQIASANEPEKFSEAVKSAWTAATQTANLTIQTLIRNETLRSAKMERLPDAPSVYLYGEIRPHSAMDPRSLVCLLSAVERRWRKQRGKVLWSQSANIPLYRYPQPYPVPADQYKLRAERDGDVLCDIRVGGEWHTLRLKQGKGHRERIDMIRELIAGRGERVEAAIIAGRNGPEIKIVAWLPRVPKAQQRSGVLTVRSTSDAFVVAVGPNDRIWRLNADHIRRYIAEHAEVRQRFSEDLKYEKRWPKDTREKMNVVLAERCTKNNDRLRDWTGVASKMLVQYAVRNRVQAVALDTTDRSYMPSFPWHAFERACEYKLDAEGITFTARRPGECEGGEEPAGAHSQGAEMESMQ